jgi:hypothetical protein
MSTISRRFVVASMRAGYAAQGAVYLTVGILALAASAGGGPAPGLIGAVRRLGDLPWHKPILVGLAIGLLLYAVWRGLDAVVDLAGHGRGFGLVERFGLFFVALLHVVFASYPLRLAIGGVYAPGGGGRLALLVADLIGNPAGRVFAMLVGLGAVSFGAYSAWKGASGGYRAHMRPSRLLARAKPLFAFGLIARGAVFAVMGAFIVWAGWNTEPLAAGGFGDALEHIRGVAYGRALLGLVGAGLIAFALYCAAEAAYRVIPERRSIWR